MKLTFHSLILLGVVAISCSPKAEQNTCERFGAIDKKMLDTYDQIEAAHFTDKNFLSRLNMSQVYWIQYRDRHLETLYPLKRKEYKKEDWENFTDCECKEMIRLTEQRIETLDMWLSGSNPYGDCPTSIE